MVFGNGNKFRIRRSQSKASYLASRRDRDRIIPDLETGVYKRTMSPSGHSTPPEDSPSCNQREPPSWTLNLQHKELSTTKPNSHILRRSSINDKSSSRTEPKRCDTDKVILPDILPADAKLKQMNRPPQLSLTPTDPEDYSPKASSPKNSFSPLRATNLSPLRIIPPATTSTTNRSQSVFKLSPPIKPQLSPKLEERLSPPKASPVASPLSSPKAEDKEEKPQVVEGLQMIQRTEVVLRVNTTTTDASSQTEKVVTPQLTRKKLQEEIDCEKLSQDFVNQLPSTDRLKELLVPGPDHKKPTDYVSGLFRIDVTSRPRPLNSPFRSLSTTPSSSPPPTTTSPGTAQAATSSTDFPTPSVVPVLDQSCPLSATSTYFTTSESKAKFLNRYSRDMQQNNIVKNTKDLSQKKQELVNRLDKKLEVLRNEQLVVSEESRINDELGENVEAHISRLARPHEAAKFRLHVEEVGQITSLLLGLSGRLARAENALMGMADDHTEKRILESKRDKLQEQLEEAKKLKENIDKRSVSVSNILCKYLSSEEYADYDHFINMKAKLIMDSKEIADKIKLGEEQLTALKETLIVAD